MTIKSLTIYCSSSDKLTEDFYNLAEQIGEYLAKKSIRIIYGGGSTGLMGKISKSSINMGGEVIGIMPRILASKEKINYEITKTLVVENMSIRKLKLFNMGYFIELLCICWNLFLIAHYTISGMLKIRIQQTKNFLRKPFSVAYISKDYDLAYKNFRQTIK